MPDVSLSNATEMVEVGVDYITATCRTPSTLSGLGAFGDFLVRASVAQGSKKRATRTLGYASIHADGVTRGLRQDGCLVRLSGHMAKEHWEQVVDLADNITRLDLQVTERPMCGPTERLNQLWAARGSKRKSTGRPPQWKAIHSLAGVETVMIGSRSSDVVLRAYNKEVESKLDFYQGCARWEVELKADLAKAHAKWLALQEDQQAAIISKVHMMFSDNADASTPDWQTRVFVQDEIACKRSPGHPPAVNRGYVFLNVCVRPLVARLWNAGLSNEVLEALGLSGKVQLTPEERQRLGPTGKKLLEE